MITVLTKAAAFFSIIVLGYVLKRIGVFRASDFAILSKIVLTVTLPCAVISNFGKMQVENTLLLIVLLGIGCNLLMIGLGYLLMGRRSRLDHAFGSINCSGYNIGTFALPYVQNFLGPVGVVATCLFDAGNAFLCTGGTYSIAAQIVGGEDKAQTGLKPFLKNLFSSIPVNTYLVMLIISALHLQLPQQIFVFTDIAGAANGFLAMLMLGIGFELKFDRTQVADIVRILLLRYGVATVLSLAAYHLAPFSLEVRQVLAIVAFAPISSVCPAFTHRIGGNVGLSSAINSLSILISIVVMTSLLIGMRIGF